MPQNFEPGDFLIFQLESGFALLRVLAVETVGGDTIWHLTAYRDLFLDVETTDAILEYPESLTVEMPHVMLTDRAFESTQVAKMKNVPLTDEELVRINANTEISDRSVRLLLGLR